MKRYLKHIFLALTATLMAVSCLEELEIETPTFGDEVVTLVPRVQSFANRYVTKSEYVGNETMISKYTVLVFNKDGNLVHKQSVTGDDPFKLNKSMLNSSANGDLTEATVVMLANMDYADVNNTDVNNTGATVTKLSDFETCTYKPAQAVITSISDGFTGFPMIGGIKMVNLSSTKDQQPSLAVELKILYAKIHFEIAVAEGGENDNVATNGMQFVLSGCTVYNSATATSIAIPAVKDKPAVDFLGDPVSEEPAEVDGATSSSNYSGSTATSLGKTGTAKLNGDKINFTFYVLESRYNHGSDLRGIYPDDSWLASTPQEDVKGYNADTDDAKRNGVKYYYDDRIQQYKPKLAKVPSGNPAGKATYVRLNGTYTDYRGVAWNVEYDLYLGKDNAQNFHVDRNSEYTNLVTIKGLRNRQDDAYGENDVWIDHRVKVSYNGNGVDDHVTITRETLLDAHIEVRPLRVKWDNNEFDGVRIYLPTKTDGSLVDWIGIERFTGKNNADGSTYCLIDDEANPGKKKSSGKRKYFTTDLISELQTKEGEYGVRVDKDTNKKYIYLLNGDCAWIYFDENLGSEDRPAEIRLEFYTPSGSTKDVVYKVKQRCLQTVGGYAIESYEEYLHSYDSADKYNLSTSPVDYTQQGLAWGFQDHKLSQSILVSSIDAPLKDDMIKLYTYDYFHERDNSSFKPYKKTSGSWAIASFGTGHTFTELASANRDIAVRDMGTIPENAYQYCLSKNKFEVVDLEEVTMTINWYLPDAYEMQAILAANQSGNSFVDLDSDSFYWSSQPSYETEALVYINEDSEYAKAVSSRGIFDLLRKSQNRIRCVYNPNAKPLPPEEMEDRVPDGIGGNYSIYMKAWYNGSFGYFNYMLPKEAKSKTDSGKWNYNTTETNYPNADNGSSISGEKFKYIKTTDKDGNPIEGFEINPGEDNKANSWTPYVFNYVIGSRTTDYYTTLYSFPGLSPYTMKQFDVATYINESGLNINPDYIPTLGVQNAYKPTTTPKSGTKKVTSKSVKELDKKLPSASDLRTLDHLNGGKMLNISFDQSKGSSLPVFVYDELVSGNDSTYTRNWIKPTYSDTTYTLDGSSVEEKAQGEDNATGGSVSQYLGGSVDKAKQNAFEDAYEKAKKKALANLNALLETDKYQDYELVESSVYYLPDDLKWNSSTGVKYSNQSGSKYTGWTIKCTVTLTAYGTFKKNSELKLWLQDANTGRWGNPVPDSKPLTPAINTDQLRMYCGNSFTISLSEDAKQQGYEITKVKVQYSGNNYVGESSNGLFGYGADDVYARFVDADINLANYKLDNQPVIGSTETLKLPGMDYSADDETGWHQWTGEGRNSVTLILADYNVNYNGSSFSYSYMYDTSPFKSEKYIIVDQIDVKCAKKKNATFDFKKIYTENGNTETSDCTVKHITFTSEGGTEDRPSGATAEGLKLYAGSKVTFKALDGYVINSISGDESLTFKGSKQTVEFTGLPEKTITAPIVVLYSKAATETD